MLANIAAREKFREHIQRGLDKHFLLRASVAADLVPLSGRRASFEGTEVTKVVYRFALAVR